MTQIKETAQVISEFSEQHKLPIVATFIGNQQVIEGQKILHTHHVPCFAFPHAAVWTIAQAAKRHGHNQQNQQSSQTIAPYPTQIQLPNES